jgi:disulfide bond formation protein DsbB
LLNTNDVTIRRSGLTLASCNGKGLHAIPEYKEMAFDRKSTNWNILFATWLFAAMSTMGSIFFSHVMDFAPCVLCWYQRIFLFPLVIILAVGLFPLDRNVLKYSLPLAMAGWLTALYHNLLYSELLPKSIQPCSQGVSCTEEYIDLFGFLTIPMMSLVGFSIINFLLVTLKWRMSK